MSTLWRLAARPTAAACVRVRRPRPGLAAPKRGLAAGIVGVPNVGKSTLFNALTQSRAAEANNFPFCTIEVRSTAGRPAPRCRAVLTHCMLAAHAACLPWGLAQRRPRAGAGPDSRGHQPPRRGTAGGLPRDAPPRHCGPRSVRCSPTDAAAPSVQNGLTRTRRRLRTSLQRREPERRPRQQVPRAHPPGGRHRPLRPLLPRR